MLTLEDIHTFLGKSHVIQGVSMNVDQGKVVALLGRNGVGKTTLIRSTMGLIPTSEGRTIFMNEDITDLPAHARVRKGIGLAPQGRQIFPSLTVLENLQINSRPGIVSAGHKWDLERILHLFPRLTPRLSNRGDQLSGGEQQMLAIGRALIGNPSCLLMDEPSEGLAPIIVDEISVLIGELKARGLSILLVEQNFNFAMDSADYVYLMNKGQIVYESVPAELIANPEVKEKYLGI
jgi:branched-chain amino acid transport system ATP-binding protein